MATMQIPHNRTSPLLFLIAALILAVVLLTLSQPSNHAVSRHDTNAWSVTQRFGQIDPDDDDLWSRQCLDGRWYTFRKLPIVDGGKQMWDVSIDYMEGGVLRNVTRYTCSSANWIARKREWCDPQK